MLPDSTVSDKKHSRKRRSGDNIDGIPIKKTKKKPDKKGKKPLKKKFKTKSSKDEASEDMDLSKELHPISHYIKDRKEMVKQMFSSLKKQKLNSMLPDILKKHSVKEIEGFCCEQLEIMSKKRIRSLLDGKKNEEISSSDTEDEFSSDNDADLVVKAKEKGGNSQPPDSTSMDVDAGLVKEIQSMASKSFISTMNTNTVPAEQVNSLEILELELRARAIKKMLESQPVSPKYEEEDEEGGGVPEASLPDQETVEEENTQFNQWEEQISEDDGNNEETTPISSNVTNDSLAAQLEKCDADIQEKEITGMGCTQPDMNMVRGNETIAGDTVQSPSEGNRKHSVENHNTLYNKTKEEVNETTEDKKVDNFQFSTEGHRSSFNDQLGNQLAAANTENSILCESLISNEENSQVHEDAELRDNSSLNSKHSKASEDNSQLPEVAETIIKSVTTSMEVHVCDKMNVGEHNSEEETVTAKPNNDSELASDEITGQPENRLSRERQFSLNSEGGLSQDKTLVTHEDVKAGVDNSTSLVTDGNEDKLHKVQTEAQLTIEFDKQRGSPVEVKKIESTEILLDVNIEQDEDFSEHESEGESDETHNYTADNDICKNDKESATPNIDSIVSTTTAENEVHSIRSSRKSREKTPEITAQRYRHRDKSYEYAKKTPKLSSTLKSDKNEKKKNKDKKRSDESGKSSQDTGKFLKDPITEREKGKERHPRSEVYSSRGEQRTQRQLQDERRSRSRTAPKSDHSNVRSYYTKASDNRIHVRQFSSPRSYDRRDYHRGSYQARKDSNAHPARYEEQIRSKPQVEQRQTHGALHSDRHPPGVVHRIIDPPAERLGKTKRNVLEKPKITSIERSKSPIRFPSPDIEIIEGPTRPPPPVVVLSDSD